MRIYRYIFCTNSETRQTLPSRILTLVKVIRYADVTGVTTSPGYTPKVQRRGKHLVRHAGWRRGQESGDL